MALAYSSDVIAAVATPPGRGGIGVVRLSGPALDPFFAGILDRVPQPRHAHYLDFRDRAGAVIDRGLALYFPAPHSYTGEHVLELQGHGGPAVMQLLLERVLDLGARLAQPGEFTQRAFLNGQLDLAQAESVADLIEAGTASAARAAMRSLRGEFSREVKRLVEALTRLRMFTEATLDFPDEDVEFLREADARGQLATLREGLSMLAAQARQGRLLREGVHVVLIGRPNVGKSSLLNRLAGEEIAIVTPHAGTTRDAIRQAIEIRGVPLHLIDTAGLREAGDLVERIGIERTWRAIAHADLAILIVDDQLGIDAADRAILERLEPALPRIVVHNKIDLTQHPPERTQDDAAQQVYLSAKTGAGIDLLRAAVLDAIGAGPAPDEAFIARERHVRALQEAGIHLALASDHAETQTMPVELLAEELRLAQEALSAITGEFTADDLLGEIFSRFCIGK